MSGDWSKIYTTCSEVEAHLIKGLLEGEGIPCIVKSQRVSQFPLTVDGMGEIDIYLSNEDVEAGLALLEEYLKKSPEVKRDKQGKIIYPRLWGGNPKENGQASSSSVDNFQERFREDAENS